jgi:PAS domain S-box-containing protein
MKQSAGPIRLLLDLMLIMAGAGALVLLASHWLPLGTNPWVASLLQVSLLLLLAGPLVYWRSMVMVQSLRAPARTPLQAAPLGSLSFTHAVILTAAAQAVGLLATVGGVFYLRGSLDQAERVQFDQQAQRIKSEIAHRFAQPIYGLTGLRSTYAAKLASKDSTPLTLAEFDAAVSMRDLPREFPGVSAFAFVERVQRADTASFVQRIQQEWGPQFAVRSSGTAADLMVVTQVAPLESNRVALGFDVGQEPVRREAAERAISTGQVTVSGPITFLLDKTRPTGFLIFLPVYYNGTAPTQAGGLASPLAGLVFCPVAAGALFSGTREAASSNLQFAVYDGSTMAPNNLVYDDAAPKPGSADAAKPAGAWTPKFQADEVLYVGGRLYTLRLQSTPQFEAVQDRSSLAVAGLGGASVSFLMALSVWLLAAGRMRAQNLANRMTVDLDRLARVARHTDSVVLLVDANGQISWVNEGFTRLTGRTLDEVKNQPALSLIRRDLTPEDTVLALTQHALRGETFRGTVVVSGADGLERWLDLELQPNHDALSQFSGFMQIGTDITAQKQTQKRLEAAMRESSTLLSTFEMHSIVSVADRQGNIIEVNDAFCDISGYTREELLGQNHRILSSGTHPDEFWAGMWADISIGKPWRADVCDKTKQGSFFWVDNIVTPFIGDDGLAERYVSIRTDITARKSAELALQASEAFLDRAGRIAGVGGWHVDLLTGKIAWSKVTKQMHDVSDDFEPDLATAINFYAPEARPIIERAVEVGIKEGKGWDLELPFITATGRPIWVRAVGEVEFANGVPVALVGAFQDITDRRNRDEELHLLEACVGRINDAILITKANVADWLGPEIVFANPAFETLTGFSVAEVVGKTPRILQGPETDRAELGLIKSALLRGDSHRTELLNYTKAGVAYWIEIDISPVRSTTGEITHFVAVERDVTGRREQAAALYEAVLRAEQATASKGQFLANMSHEIRTPMNAIIGMLALLHRTELSPQQLDYASKSQTAAHSLLGLINDILDFSKVEAGKMTMDPQPFTVSKLMRDLAVILSTNAGTKGIDVLFDIDSALPPVLLGDAMRLQQILINLGGNAVKFTAEGQVVVSVRLECVSDGNAHVNFAVKDSGIGIAPENQHKIFAGFSQAEASTTRKFGGTGLGLAISKHMIEMMGGDLVLISAIGEGSVFAFTLALPVVIDVPEELAVAPRLSVPAQRVLVVDDNLAACEITAHMAQSWNWPTESVHSGEQALALVAERAAQGPFPFDVIYLDWHLPGMDGWEVARHLRAAHAAANAASLPGINGAVSAPPLTLIMVTASSRESLAQRTEAEQALLDGFLVKPLTASSLLDATLQSGAAKVGVRQSRRPAASQRRLNGMRLLVVEDNLINQQVAEELLISEGANVSLAANGQLGVDAVRFANLPFDAVLMDIQMPVLDGFGATRVIREHLGLTDLPIIAMTANAMNSDRDDCLAAGMNAHVGKPFDLTVLVKTLLSVSGFTAVVSAAVPAGTSAALSLSRSPSQTPAAAAAPAQSGGIDLAGALARLSGMDSLYLRAAKEFVKVIPTVMDEFRHLLEADRKQATMQMHTIKSNAALLGAKALTELTAVLEGQCKSNTSAGEIAAQMPHLERTLDATRIDLQAVIVQLSPQAHDDDNHGADTGTDSVQAAPASAALRAQLEALAALLADSDLAALGVFAEMRALFPAALQDLLCLLEEALQRLEMDEAHTHCRALIAALDTLDSEHNGTKL